MSIHASIGLAAAVSGSTGSEDLMKNAVIMASYAYHAAMSDERVPRKTPAK